MRCLSHMVLGSIAMFVATLGHAGCCGGGPCCPVSYPDATIAAALAPIATVVTSANIDGQSSNQVFLLPNEVLMTFTVGSQPIVTPLYRYGCSYLYFAHIPRVGLVWDGWIPVVFEPNDSILAAYFACNSLQVIPKRVREQIAALVFPISCSTAKPPCTPIIQQ